MSEHDEHEIEDGEAPAVAIIGMAARFPGASTLEDFWANLAGGVESVDRLSDEDLAALGVDPALTSDPRYVRACPRLEGIELFDAAFFDVSPREAEILDPQSRLFLECAWEALERAGYAPGTHDGWTGVFAGSSASSYLYQLWSHPEVMASMGWFQVYLGNDRDYFTTRVSYKLDLKGPSLNVQTACSTSLVAVHQACQSLLDYQCTMALAGGVRVAVPQAGYLHEAGGILSPDGSCRAFDAGGEGSIFGNGVGVVVLKRLEDALADGDRIDAVLRGSAVNNDGSSKVGFTAPSISGQAEAIAMALEVAGVAPESVSYVETHGSGTPLGDPIEVRALADAFGEAAGKGTCALGSVKTNFGHLESAAGVAGLIKTVLALQHRQIPPSLHFERPNPQIDFDATPFYVNAELRDWPAGDGPRRAGVSSFGMGGTNVHAIVEETPEREPSGPSRPWQLVLLSARTPTALEATTAELAAALAAPGAPPLADAAYTLAVGRRPFEHRRALVARDAADAARALDAVDPARVLTRSPAATGRPVAFLLPGLGDHYLDMGRGLYAREEVFRRAIDRCAEVLREHLDVDLRRLLYRDGGEGEVEEPADGGVDLARMLGRASRADNAGDDAAVRRLASTRHAQPAVFAVEIALARLWTSWGIAPKALIGHSLGELAAACLAGVLSLEDALRLVAERARLVDRLPPGAMLAVPLAEDALRELLGPELGVAAVNGPEVAVASGPVEAIEALEKRLERDGVSSKRLPTTHAFHSPQLEPARAELERTLAGLELRPPEVPVLSNVTGTWLTDAEATDPAYWGRHMVAPVRFAEGVAELLREDRVLLEVGPGQGLGALVAQHPAAGPERRALPSLRSVFDRRDDQAFALDTLGRLWLEGVEVDWPGFWAGEDRRRVALPTYPFERRRFWIGPAPATREQPAEDRATGKTEKEALELHARPDLPTPYAAPETELERAVVAVWQELLGVGEVGIHDSYFDLGGHSLLAPKLLMRVERACGVALPLEALVNAPTVAGLCALVERVRVEGQTALAAEAVDLAAEVALDDEIRPQGEASPRPAWSDPGTVFVTGATGFLGAFLVDRLLAQTRARVVCLARADSDREARARVLANLERYRLSPENAAARIEGVAGDLEKPLLGLAPATFDALAERADVVLHAGAWVNFTYPYSALAAANVGGTREALRLAARGRVKPFHFVSSTAVFAPAAFDARGLVYEDDPLEHTAGLFSGYAESKWVAEKILGLARERGLPVAVYRPGVVGGDGSSGAGNPRDMVWNLLKGCIEMGACVDGLPALDVAPADYVAGALVHLMRRPGSLGGAFHFPNPRPGRWDDAFETLSGLGYPLRRLSYPAWLAELRRVAEAGEENALVPFLPLLLEGAGEEAEEGAIEPLAEGEMRGQAHDGSRTREALEGSPIACPPVDGELLRTYVAYFVDVGFLPPPPRPGDAGGEPALAAEER